MKNSTGWKWGIPLALVIAVPGLIGADRHITPTVVLEKQADVIRSTLPEAHQYFLKTVEVGREDLAHIQREGDFKLEDPKVKFYLGKDDTGQLVGVVLFPQVNTQHGPLEVGLTMGADGRVQDVSVTKATVETKPWIQKAIGTGFLKEFEGAQPADGASKALAKLRQAHSGTMSEWIGQVAIQAVREGSVLYQTLYTTGSS